MTTRTTTTTTTNGTHATPSGRQSEQQNKGECGVGRRYGHARASPPLRHPDPRSLRGVVGVRSLFLSFNLTFPANGQPGVNSTALIATRQSPTGSVRGGDFTLPPPRLLRSPAILVFPATFSHWETTRTRTTYGSAYFHALSSDS